MKVIKEEFSIMWVDACSWTIKIIKKLEISSMPHILECHSLLNHKTNGQG